MSEIVSPTPWKACGNIVRDADSIEVCTVALWCKSPSEVAQRIVTAVNAQADPYRAVVETVLAVAAENREALAKLGGYEQAERRCCQTCRDWSNDESPGDGWGNCFCMEPGQWWQHTPPTHSCAAWQAKEGAR